jgi:hypothetical protein
MDALVARGPATLFTAAALSGNLTPVPAAFPPRFTYPVQDQFLSLSISLHFDDVKQVFPNLPW